jgi:signal peptidase I
MLEAALERAGSVDTSAECSVNATVGRGAAGRAVDLAVYVVVGLTVLVAWMTLAPPSLGGGSRYGAVVGTSMEPNLTAGDLIVVRPGTYRVGDIVAYRADGRLVVHRVVEAHGGRLVLRGDANGTVDPLRPTAAEVLGEVRLRVPGLGVPLGFLRAHLMGFVLGGALLVSFARWCESASRPARPARSTSATR